MNTLTIARHNATYLTPTSLRSDETRQQLDRVMAHQLPDALGQQLATIARADDGIWLIRRLDVDLSLLDLSATNLGSAGKRWAEAAAHSLRALLAAGSDGRNVLYFPDRAAYVAQFIADVLSDVAWQRWYYAPFETLRALPAPEAARQALLRDEELAEQVLLHLARMGYLAPLLDALRPNDLTALLESCRKRATTLTPSLPVIIDQLLALWPKLDLRPQYGWANDLNRLFLWLAWRQAHPGVTPSRHLFAAIDQLLHLAEQLLSSPHARPRVLDPPRGQSGWLAKAAAVIAPATQAVAQKEVTELSPYGALFLLLPSLIQLGLHQSLSIDGIENSTVAIWRACLACKLLGRQRWPQTRHSPLVWQLMGLPAPPDEAQWQAAIAAATPARCEQWRQSLIVLLQRQGKLSGRFVALEQVSSESYPQGVWLLRDMLHDYWLRATTSPLDPATVAEEMPGLYLWRPTITYAPDDPSVAPFVRQSKPAPALLDYLALPPTLPPELDLTLSVAAAAVLRAFAHRLPGFKWSSFDHLYRNFLAGESQIRYTASEVLVELPRSPLHSILRMAGYHGYHYSIPWLDDRPIVLQLPEAS